MGIFNEVEKLSGFKAGEITTYCGSTNINSRYNLDNLYRQQAVADQKIYEWLVKDPDEKEEIKSMTQLFNDRHFENPIVENKFIRDHSVFYNLPWDGEDEHIYKRCTFKGENGTVTFSIMPLPSCCGIYFLYDPYFRRNSHKSYSGLYHEFHEFLDTQMDRNKLFISTTLEENNNWGGFVKECGWIKGKPTYNGNSGNHVVLWEHSKTKLIGRDLKKVYSTEDED